MDEYTQSAIDELLESCSLKEQDKEKLPQAERLPLPETVGETTSSLQEKGIRPLFNKTTPQYVNQHEKYEHRLVAFLKAEGHSNVEIARLSGLSSVTINYLVKQPYMETLILEEIHKHGDEALKLLAKESLAAAERLIEIAKCAENEETKRKANNDILDRKYGRPNQPMSLRQVDATEVSDADLLKVLGKN